MALCKVCPNAVNLSAIDGFTAYVIRSRLNSHSQNPCSQHCKLSELLTLSSKLSPRGYGGVLGFQAQRRELAPRRRASARASEAQNELQTAEELREQLEALQDEAEQVHGRANSARARFMRLTDAVEQLRQRAAIDVRIGNEASARHLLVEKQKVMRALEAARRRAELLEQLAAKLNVAISMKETQLIAALSCARLGVAPEAAGDMTVRVVSPRDEQEEQEEEETTKSTDLADDKLLIDATPNADHGLLAQNRAVGTSAEELTQATLKNARTDEIGNEARNSLPDTGNLARQAEQNSARLDIEPSANGVQTETSERRVSEEVRQAQNWGNPPVDGLRREGDVREAQVSEEISQLKRLEQTLDRLEESAQADIQKFDTQVKNSVRRSSQQSDGSNDVRGILQWEEEVLECAGEGSLNMITGEGASYEACMQNVDGLLKRAESEVHSFLEGNASRASARVEVVTELLARLQSTRARISEAIDIKEQKALDHD